VSIAVYDLVQAKSWLPRSELANDKRRLIGSAITTVDDLRRASGDKKIGRRANTCVGSTRPDY
jgi:hypothetical protein